MSDQKKVIQTLALISQVGISMIAPILLCVLLGVFLENRFNVSFMIPLIVAGILAGIRNVYALVKQAGKVITDEKEEK